jgi:hypothetical protein
MAAPAEGEPAPMAEPSEDEILQKAKELCRDDDKAWDSADFEGGSATKVVAIATDSDHA